MRGESERQVESLYNNTKYIRWLFFFHSHLHINLTYPQCKKSMARIKFVLNERQKAYEEAARLVKNGSGSEATKL
jgi:hypothetical protein